ncbi:hypothetical protein HOY80DRAFT_1114327 [Tuber brumale]|nr:hypothetical protein HOY80DRAFT_1114327 [Tuber brumale]
MAIHVEHSGKGKAGLEMLPLGNDWKNQVGACLILELVDLRKRIGSDGKVEERGVMDKYETIPRAIWGKSLGESFNFRGLTVSPPALLHILSQRLDDGELVMVRKKDSALEEDTIGEDVGLFAALVN